MMSELCEQIITALAQFLDATRLYALKLPDDSSSSGGLLVEAFLADEALQEIGVREIIVLSVNANIDLINLLGQRASLEVSLPDATRTAFSGYITEAAMLGSEGGLARFRLRLMPWLWQLGQTRNSRVWQDKTVIEIIESVFDSYLPQAQWRWSDEVPQFMADAPERSYCCQYRETDLAFVTRILTEEGLAWRFEEQGEDHCMVLFADSSQPCAVPEDASSVSGGGIRFHAARAGEVHDSIQALRTHRALSVGLTTVQSYDYKAKQMVAASVPSKVAPGGKNAPTLESYDHPGQYAYANLAQARRYGELQMQAHEARSTQWQGRSTVRTLRPGTRFTLLQGPLRQVNAAPDYTVLRVCSLGVNNLPTPAITGLAEFIRHHPRIADGGAPATRTRIRRASHCASA